MVDLDAVVIIPAQRAGMPLATGKRPRGRPGTRGSVGSCWGDVHGRHKALMKPD